MSGKHNPTMAGKLRPAIDINYKQILKKEKRKMTSFNSL